MASVENILKKLNKGKSEEDRHMGVLGDRKIVREKISTGSPMLDKILGGGFSKSGYNSIVGAGSAGKSSLALLACNDVISRGQKVVYYDAEYTMDSNYFSRMGVDTSMVILEQSRNLEDMLDFVEAMSTADDVGLIVLDSIPIFTATAVEAKGAGDHTIGIEAGKFTRRMPIIEGNCARRNIGIIGLTSYKLNPNAMGADPRVLSRGLWQLTMSDIMLDITKKNIIFDKDNIAIGHKLDVRVKKTKRTTFDPKKKYTLDFYYDGGFNPIREYVMLFIEMGLINKGGAGWLTFDNENADEVKLQGIDNAVDYFKENTACYEGYKKMLDSAFDPDNIVAEIDETEGLDDFKEEDDS